MLRSAQLIVCCVLAISGFGQLARTELDRPHDDWLQQRYFEATSIKAGMTRADLLRLFREDGGLQQMLATRYVLRRSSMIKVDVEFDVPPGARIVPEDDARRELSGDERLQREGYRVVPNEQLKIKSISKPYLEQFTYD